VLSHSVPALRHYRPEAARRAILPDLAALVWSAVNHLVWPPLAHADVGSPEAVAVHIVYMHQDLMGAVSHINKARLEVRGSLGLRVSPSRPARPARGGRSSCPTHAAAHASPHPSVSHGPGPRHHPAAAGGAARGAVGAAARQRARALPPLWQLPPLRRGLHGVSEASLPRRCVARGPAALPLRSGGPAARAPCLARPPRPLCPAHPWPPSRLSAPPSALRARTSLPHETDMEVTQYLDLEVG
jgi:hypothetical protein